MALLSPDSVRALRRDLDAAATVHDIARSVRLRHPRLAGGELVTAVHEVLADMAGLGPLRDALAMPGVTDVLVCAHDLVYIERDGVLQQVVAAWPDEAALRAYAVRLATTAQVRLDQLCPFADFQLPGGLRCHIVIPPLAASTTISVRVPSHVAALRLAELLDGQHPDVLGVLERVVRSRCSYLISGGTGSGKTTLLAGMLAAVDPGERVVIVEDAAELGAVHPHLVQLRARPASSEGVGEVSMRTMVRQAMRMRPDRLVVGEVRGVEVVDLLAAMNTGHEGAAATLHANSAVQVQHRIRTLCLMAGIPVAAADSLLATAVDVVIHVQRHVSGRRRVAEVAVVSPLDGRIVPALTFGEEPGHGPGSADLDHILERAEC